MKKFCFSMLMVLFFAGFAVAQIPTVYTVGSGGGYDYTTIQAGINACSNGDRVQVYPGTYTENIDFLGKRIKVQSVSGAGRTIIDGGAAGSVVTMDSGEVNLTHLDGFTVRNGTGTTVTVGGWAWGCGGGIMIRNDSHPTIKNCFIRDNSATHIGGGIYAERCSPIIKDNKVYDNSTTYSHGGGMFIGRHCGDTSAKAEYDPEVYGNEIYENYAQVDGGGIYFDCIGDDAVFDDNEIYLNEVGSLGWGSGVCIKRWYSGLTISNNIIRDNDGTPAVNGGALTIYDAQGDDSGYTCYMVNNVVEGNDTIGISIYRQYENTFYLTNNTIIDNGNPGLRIDGYWGTWPSSVLTVYVENCIFWGNYSTGDEIIVDFDSHLDIDYCVLEGGDSGIWTGNDGWYTYGGDMVTTDPDVDATYHIDSDSSAYNAGNNSATGLPTYDFEGDNRIIDTTVDIGADEDDS